jgi:hypothetical protein
MWFVCHLEQEEAGQDSKPLLNTDNNLYELIVY